MQTKTLGSVSLSLVAFSVLACGSGAETGSSPPEDNAGREGETSSTGGTGNTGGAGTGGAGTRDAAGGAGTGGSDSASSDLPVDPTDPEFSFSQTFHVATSGSDDNPGTEAQPWRTIQKAAETLTAGQRVYVHSGTYEGDVEVESSGSKGRWIAFDAFPGDEGTVVLDGAAFRIRQKDYIKVSGLKVQNTPDNCGITAMGPATGLYVSDNHTDNTYGSGICVWGVQYRTDPGTHDNYFDVFVRRNKVERACYSGFNESITIANGIVDFRVTDNEVCCTDHLDLQHGKDGIDIKEGARNGIVARNLSYNLKRQAVYIDAGGVLEFAKPQMHDIHVFENVAYDNGSFAVHVGTEGDGDSFNIHIYNNLGYDNGQDGLMIYKHPASSGNVYATYVYNNTFVGNGRFGIILNDETASVSFWNNVVFDNGSGKDTDFRMQAGSYVESNNLIGVDPLFVDRASGDFRVISGSPAIDAGADEHAPAVDMDGRLRESPVDIGAYEF